MPLATKTKRGSTVADLLIRKLDPVVMERLKAQAKRNGRSTEAEVRAIIADNVQITMREWLDRVHAYQQEHPYQPSGISNADILREARREQDEALWRVAFPDEEYAPDPDYEDLDENDD